MPAVAGLACRVSTPAHGSTGVGLDPKHASWSRMTVSSTRALAGLKPPTAAFEACDVPAAPNCAGSRLRRLGSGARNGPDPCLHPSRACSLAFRPRAWPCQCCHSNMAWDLITGFVRHGSWHTAACPAMVLAISQSYCIATHHRARATAFAAVLKLVHTFQAVRHCRAPWHHADHYRTANLHCPATSTGTVMINHRGPIERDFCTTQKNRSRGLFSTRRLEPGSVLKLCSCRILLVRANHSTQGRRRTVPVHARHCSCGAPPEADRSPASPA